MAKIRVHVLTTYDTANSAAFNYPLLINRHFFKGQGIEIDFYKRLNDKIYNCDVLFINSKFFRKWYPEKEENLYTTLADFKKRLQKVIWFDTTDSTGTTQFNIMPFVGGYYKTQVLKDRSLYAKTFDGYRIFTDYYNKLSGAGDAAESPDGIDKNRALSVVLQKEDAHKLHVSWNNAMYEWSNLHYRLGYLIANIKGQKDYKVRFTNPDKERKVDILGRIGIGSSPELHNRDAVRYQRGRIAGILRERFNVDTSKIARGQYLREIRNSKIGVSPFGMGEISCRDFEIIINGALLFKQDMSHLETWPSLYVNNETYVPFSWDFGDFEEKLRTLLNNREKIVKISKRAQELYSYYLYGKGRQEFRDKVLNIIG
jgi:hypothetical protein